MIAGKRHRAARLGLIAAAAVVATLALASTAIADPPGASSDGAFVIGDQNAQVGAQVTFWGAQWWQDNALTPDPAPASFKGYADTATATCGGDPWTTRPGNSSFPPAEIGDVITVVVASHVDKSGDVISGDTAAVATVAVDPGYADNPGHPGTGTITDVVPCNDGGGIDVS
jgi:hypothetical protein